MRWLSLRRRALTSRACRRPLRRALRRLALERAGDVQHRGRVLRALGARPDPVRALLGGRGRRHRRVHLLGPRDAGQPARERACAPGRWPGRQGRADPAAATGDAHRASGRLQARRDRRAALVPVRSRRARVPACEQRGKGRLRRPAIAAATSCRSANGCRSSSMSSASRVRANRSSRRSKLLVERASRHFTPVETSATDPALLIYTSGTTGPPKGALMPHACLLGNLPGFIHSHDGFPQPGRSVLVAGGLGLDRRPDGRAAADAVLRPADRRLSRPLRRGARVPADRALPDPQHVPVPDRAQADDEGVSAAARSVRREPAQRDERRRSGRHDGVRMGARRAGRHRSTRCSARPR